MDIERLVERYYASWARQDMTMTQALEAALTELAAEYEQKQALLLEAHCERVISLQERISQLEAERVPEGWIPVSERLPPHNTHVVGLWQHPNGVTEFDVVFYEYDGDWYCESVRDPDYWCALPYAEPPAPQPKKENV